MPTLLEEVEVHQSQTAEMLAAVHDQTLGQSLTTESTALDETWNHEIQVRKAKNVSEWDLKYLNLHEFLH